MDEIDKLHLLAELSHDFCELNHGPGTRREDFPATDYIVMPFGYPESDVSEVSERELVVPVCEECARALLGNEWTLLYCFECCSSQWVSRKLAKNSYRDHILWMKGCPHCACEFGGVHFKDLKAVKDSATFLGNLIDEIAA
ncbi:MAG: hypothetical protein KQH63_04140 [Desulfobulbaceae bacterium]|nr:hypothetical protein [Desulfobulbaceae bacterium]